MIIILIILFTSCLYSVEFSGRVIEHHNGKGIHNATIIVDNGDYSTKTDKLGYFNINLSSKGKIHIDVVKLSYKSLHYNILIDDSLKSFVFKMHPLEFHLDEISVGGEQYHSDLDEFYNQHSDMNESQLNSKLRLSIAQTVENELGMSMTSLGPAPARPVLHGLSGNRVQINSDGIPTVDMSATSADHAVATDPSAARAVTVIRGPKTLIYNSSAAGGVIDIKRDDIPTDQVHRTHLNSKTYFESVNNMWNTVLESMVPLSSLMLKSNISYKNSSNLYTPMGTLNNTETENLNFNIGLSRSFDDLFLGTSWNEMYMDYGIPPDPILGHPLGVDITMFRRNNNLRGAFHMHESKISDIRFDLSRTYYSHDERSANGLSSANYSIENYFTRIEAELEDLNLIDHGSIGVQYNNKQLLTGGRVSTPNILTNDVAIFLFSEKTIEKNEYQFSMRNDNSWIETSDNRSRVFNTFSLSFAYFRKLSESFSSGFTISRSSRTPSAEELYSNEPHLAVYSYEIGNSDLQVEHSWNFELLSSFETENFSFATTLYTNEYSNFIFTRNTGDTNWVIILPIYQTANLAARIAGCDAVFEYQITQFIKLNSQTSYTYGQLTGSNRPLPWIPPLRNITKLFYSRSNFNFSIISNYTSAQNRIDEFEKTTDGFIIFGLSADYAFTLGSVSASIMFNIDNIFDTEYYNHLSRIKHLMPEAGRNIRLGLVMYY